MNILHSSSKYPLGIDISDKSIKLVQLARHHHAITIQTAGVINVPKDFIVQGEIKNLKGVAELIKTLKTKMMFGKISSNEVIASLSEEKTFVKLIKINSTKKDVENVIEQEIEKNIPFKLSDVNYDWQFIAQDKISQYILIGVVPKNITSQYYEVLRVAELLPLALEPEPLAISRCILPMNNEPEKTTIILKIGATYSSFMAYAAKSILFTISIPISESNIAKITAVELNIPWQQKENETAATSAAKKSPSTAKEIWENKMEQALTYLKMNYPQYAEIENIYLCYDSGSAASLPKIISKKFHIPAIQADVFINLNQQTNVMKKYLTKTDIEAQKKAQHHIKPQLAVSLATAIGLALREIYYNDF